MTTRSRAMLRRVIVYPVQGAVAIAFYGLFAALPLDAASAIGGWLGRTLGPRHPVSRRAERNLSRIFPDMPVSEIAGILRAMWDNLGRVAAEYPHLRRFRLYDGGDRVTVIGAEHVDALREDGKPGIFFSAHFGNWEIVSLGATQRGVPLDRVYRMPNTPLVAWLFSRGRAAVNGNLLPKGRRSVRPLVQALRSGRHVGMLVDQKMNDGISAPFLGRPAMTAPALAELALKFDCPVVPARVERLGGARFKLIIDPPLELQRSGDRHADVAANMARVNEVIETWIRARPDHWLWLHNRWPDWSQERRRKK